MANLNDLLAFAGQRLNVDGADNGQCTAIPHKWEQMLGLPLVLGNAIDTWNNAPSDLYDKELNTPDGVPQPGAIVVYEANNHAIGTGPYGHTGVVVRADVNTLDVFEQNDETNNPATNLIAHVQHRPNYAGVKGWFYPKVLHPQAQLVTAAPGMGAGPDIGALQAQIVSLTQQLETANTRATTAEGKVADLTQELSDMQTKLSQANTATATLTQQVSDLEAAAARYTGTLPQVTAPLPPVTAQPVDSIQPGSGSYALPSASDAALSAKQTVSLGISQMYGAVKRLVLIVFGNSKKG